MENIGPILTDSYSNSFLQMPEDEKDVRNIHLNLSIMYLIYLMHLGCICFINVVSVYIFWLFKVQRMGVLLGNVWPRGFQMVYALLGKSSHRCYLGDMQLLVHQFFTSKKPQTI